ncbi:MAG: hypothetical protein ACPG7T_09550 [Ilumatobacteraceae bacterium]
MSDTLAPAHPVESPQQVPGGIGEPVLRPDGGAKVDGSYEFSSDRSIDGELWSMTLRSPHPRARIISIDTAPALAVPGVAAVVTAADVPGVNGFGLISGDQFSFPER